MRKVKLNLSDWGGKAEDGAGYLCINANHCQPSLLRGQGRGLVSERWAEGEEFGGAPLDAISKSLYITFLPFGVALKAHPMPSLLAKPPSVTDRSPPLRLSCTYSWTGGGIRSTPLRFALLLFPQRAGQKGGMRYGEGA